MESVEPAGGSTVSTVTTRNAAARIGRTGGRAPRATATRPAITPAQPSAIAIHSDTVTKVAVRCSGCHQGGPPPARGRDRDHDQHRGGEGGRGEPASQAGEPG